MHLQGKLIVVHITNITGKPIHFLVQAPVKFGNGRIEQVQDARQAVYIYKELSKADRMSPDKTDEQILEFAKLISQLKNKRFFDSRLRRIAEIESVDSFFTAKNYIKESDATYFTTLNDYWEYGNGPVRSSGTRFSVALLPGYYFYDYNNNQSDPAYYRLIKYSLVPCHLLEGWSLSMKNR